MELIFLRNLEEDHVKMLPMKVSRNSIVCSSEENDFANCERTRTMDGRRTFIDPNISP